MVLGWADFQFLCHQIGRINFDNFDANIIVELLEPLCDFVQLEECLAKLVQGRHEVLKHPLCDAIDAQLEQEKLVEFEVGELLLVPIVELVQEDLLQLGILQFITHQLYNA